MDAISLRTTEGQIAFAAAEAIVFDISPGGVFPTADGTTTLPALPAEPRRARLARLLEPLPEGKRLAITTLVGIIWDIEDGSSGKPRAKVVMKAGDVAAMPADIRHKGYSPKRSMLLVWENNDGLLPGRYSRGELKPYPVEF